MLEYIFKNLELALWPYWNQNYHLTLKGVQEIYKKKVLVLQKK